MLLTFSALRPYCIHGVEGIDAGGDSWSTLYVPYGGLQQSFSGSSRWELAFKIHIELLPTQTVNMYAGPYLGKRTKQVVSDQV